MLAMFSLLPLLKGWGYKTHIAERKALIRGAPPEPIYEIQKILKDELGWMLYMREWTNDCYGTVHVEFCGADRERNMLPDMFPEAALALGATEQDPAGCIKRYFRPNPYSTAGIYFMLAVSGGFQGTAISFLPDIKIALSLQKESTQATAHVVATGDVVVLTDREEFIKSLRRVLNAKADLWIDPALKKVGMIILGQVEGAKK